MNLVTRLRKNYNLLCSPAQLYVLISLISIIMIFFQNMRDSRKYCVGLLSCDLTYSNLVLFALKIGYMILWAIIFDSLCKNGYTNLAWAIVLLPFLAMFIMIGMFMLSQVRM